MQQDLQDGLVPWHLQPMTADAATALIDQTEASDRATALAKLRSGLIDGGASPPAAAQIAEGVAHGAVPQQYVDAAAAAGKALHGGKEGFDHLAETAPTGKHYAPGTGKHWAPEPQMFTAQDIEALKKIGSRLGHAGTALEFGTGLYELAHGEPAGEAAAKFGASLGGAWALGQVGGVGGAAVGGPPGAFLGALILGTVGAFGGDLLADRGYKWLME